jgi:RHS repeat-associated protein
MLDDFGLIHMNGRIYDPEIGRFLSCDPYVQVPEFSQNFNRYTYVLNNPLTYTDPSGHQINEVLAAVICIVVCIIAWYVAPYIVAGIYGSLGIVSPPLVFQAAVGAVAGAISGAGNAAINGGSGSDILKGAAVGAVSGAICGGVLHGLGANGSLLRGAPVGRVVVHIVGHGIVGGLSNAAMGGRFSDSFLSGMAGCATGYFSPLESIMQKAGDGDMLATVERTAIAGIVGGTVSVIGGGKFANGAYTAAFQHLLNEESSKFYADKLATLALAQIAAKDPRIDRMINENKASGHSLSVYLDIVNLNTAQMGCYASATDVGDNAEMVNLINGVGSSYAIHSYNGRVASVNADGLQRTWAAVLAHELQHAWDGVRGSVKGAYGPGEFSKKSTFHFDDENEFRAVRTENIIREAYHLPLRNSYNGLKVSNYKAEFSPQTR